MCLISSKLFGAGWQVCTQHVLGGGSDGGCGLTIRPKISATNFLCVSRCSTIDSAEERCKPCFHYVDDFITLGPSQSAERNANVDIMHICCDDVGLPVEPEKDEGPATCITFLGLELDSEALELRLPTEKLSSMRVHLSSWRGRKVCKKRELHSLIGILAHASKVVRAGRSFVCRMIDLASSAKRLEQFVHLNREARADIEWWFLYSESWNGVAMMFTKGMGQGEINLTSDASGSSRCGAYSDSEWFMLRWPEALKELHIMN